MQCLRPQDFAPQKTKNGRHKDVRFREEGIINLQ
tara:strand:- start:1878 stop:1979 length:102 start_codon:yes stop_codon:yes gene_type:complete